MLITTCSHLRPQRLALRTRTTKMASAFGTIPSKGMRFTDLRSLRARYGGRPCPLRAHVILLRQCAEQGQARACLELLQPIRGCTACRGSRPT